MEKFTANQIKFLQEMLTHKTNKWEERGIKMFIKGETDLHHYCCGVFGAYKELQNFTKNINEKFKNWKKWKQQTEMHTGKNIGLKN